MTTDQHLRRELADFLKQRRSRLLPHKVGLPGGSRRRVAGLRREEVAELAEITVEGFPFARLVRYTPGDAATHQALQTIDAEPSVELVNTGA